MKKNECAQEMILGLVTRDGCQVKLRPSSFPGAIEIVIQRKDVQAASLIQLSDAFLHPEEQEEIVCRIIERTALQVFDYPYKEMMGKHFHHQMEG